MVSSCGSFEGQTSFSISSATGESKTNAPIRIQSDFPIENNYAFFRYTLKNLLISECLVNSVVKKEMQNIGLSIRPNFIQ